MQSQVMRSWPCLLKPGGSCYVSRQTYIKVNDTYSEGGTHEETLRPQSNARVMNKRQGDKGTIKRIADS